jgi:hypothetical protein
MDLDPEGLFRDDSNEEDDNTQVAPLLFFSFVFFLLSE